jgi:hypothetical protein
MTAAVARAVMALAGGCLGEHRRTWAMAMQGELDVAIEDGKPLTFAIGCLTSALRQMPAHAEGRFTLTSHAIVFGLMIPFAALLVSGTLLGFPSLFSGHVGVNGWLDGGVATTSLLNPSNHSAVPALALLVLALVSGHLVMPWFVLERDWHRVVVLGQLNMAATATLLIFTGILFLDETFMLLPVTGLAVEWLAIATLSRWHGHLSLGTASLSVS